MAEKLIDKCNKYIKKGKIDKLYEYIVKNNLTQELITQIFYDTYMSYRDKEQEEAAMKLSNFALKLSINNLTKKYGEKLTNRFVKIIDGMQYSSQRNFNLFRLMNMNRNVLKEEEQNKIEKILEIASKKDTIIGTHITGREVGDTYNSEGIPLTGHKFASNDYTRNNYQENVKIVLEENVSLFQDNPIEVIMQLIGNRGYNNNYGAEWNDVMIVQIPKEELEQNQEGIIIEKENGLYLNPSYIKGFARIGITDGNIEAFVDNPAFIEKDTEKKTVEELSTEEWKSKFGQWYEASKTTQMQKLKSNVINFFKGLLNKKKNQEIGEEIER